MSGRHAITPSMATIDAGGVRWAIRDRGTGGPVLLLHGFTGGAVAWAAHEAALVAAGMRVIAVDLPGHGATIVDNPAAMTVEGTADAVAALLGKMNARPAAVIGYSLGARIALRLAVTHPAAVGRLVIESPSAGLSTEVERAARRDVDEALAASIERDGIEAFVDEWERNPVFASHAALPPDTAGRIRAMRLANDPAGLAASLRAAGQGAMEPLFDRLGSLTVPTLVIAGALDSIGRPRAERVADAIPGARLALVEDVGHTPHDEQPTTFDRLVLELLQEDSRA